MRLKPLFLFLLLLLLFPFSVIAESKRPVILVLGDSLSAAYGIPKNDGWVTLLQTRLEHEGFPHTVVNASISGETTSGGVTRSEKLLQTYRPQMLILELGANDGLRGLSLNNMKTNLNRIIETSKQYNVRVVMVGMQLPPNYGPAYTRLFAQTYSDLAEKHNLPLVPFLFAGLEEGRSHFQADNFHPTSLAQSLLLNNVWATLEPLLSPHH